MSTVGVVLVCLLAFSYGKAAPGEPPVSSPPPQTEKANATSEESKAEGEESRSVYRVRPYGEDADDVEAEHSTTNKAATMDYPVKITRRIVDGDGNLRVVTIYGNKNDPALPILDERISEAEVPQRKRPRKRVRPGGERPTLPRRQEYKDRRVMRLPDNGEEYESKRGTTTEEGSSTSYKRKTSIKFDAPERLKHPSSVQDKINTPLAEAGSSHGDGYSYEDQDDADDYSPVDRGEDRHYIGGGGDDDEGYRKEHAKFYKAGHKEASGGGGNTGYKGQESFDKGTHEEHDHEENQGIIKGEAGEKKGHIDELNKFSEGHHATSGRKDSSQLKSKGHKKGRKTTGFHKVHHKDEYKKDEVFYDEDHSLGEEKDAAEGQDSYNDEEGGNAKLGSLNSGFTEASKGHSGDKHKGHSYYAGKGHSGHTHQKGGGGHRSNYGEKLGFSHAGEHGHSSGGHHYR